jgi:hypothetical protein
VKPVDPSERAAPRFLRPPHTTLHRAHVFEAGIERYRAALQRRKRAV